MRDRIHRLAGCYLLLAMIATVSFASGNNPHVHRVRARRQLAAAEDAMEHAKAVVTPSSTTLANVRAAAKTTSSTSSSIKKPAKITTRPASSSSSTTTTVAKTSSKPTTSSRIPAKTTSKTTTTKPTPRKSTSTTSSQITTKTVGKPRPTVSTTTTTTTRATSSAASASATPAFPYIALLSDKVWNNAKLGLVDFVWGSDLINESPGATSQDIAEQYDARWIRDVLSDYGLNPSEFDVCSLELKKGPCHYNNNRGWARWSMDKIRAYYLSWAVDGYSFVVGQTLDYYREIEGILDFGTWMRTYILPSATRPPYYPAPTPYDGDASIWKIGLDLLPAILMCVSVAYPPAMFVLIAEQTIQAGYTAMKDAQGSAPTNLMQDPKPIALTGSAEGLADNMLTLFHHTMDKWELQLQNQWRSNVGNVFNFQTTFGGTTDYLSPQTQALNWTAAQDSVENLWRKQAFLTALETQNVYLLKLQPTAYQDMQCTDDHLHNTLGYSDQWFCADDGQSIYKYRRPVYNSAIPNPFPWNEVSSLSDYDLDIDSQYFVELPLPDGTVPTATRQSIASSSEQCYKKYPAPNLNFNNIYPKMSYVQPSFTSQKALTSDCYWNVPICTLQDPFILAGCKRETFFQTALLMQRNLPYTPDDDGYWRYDTALRFSGQDYPVPHDIGDGTFADNHSCDGPSGEVLGAYCDNLLTRFKWDQASTGATGYRPDEMSFWGPLPNL